MAERLMMEENTPMGMSYILGAFTKLRIATITFSKSEILSARNNSASTGGIFLKPGS